MKTKRHLERIRLISRYLRYYLRAKTRYQVHSPFVFDFCERVLDDNAYYYAFDDLAELRQGLLSDKHRIQVTDFGAGSHVAKGPERSVNSIARSAVSPEQQGRLLFRLIHHYKPRTLLEMGTSLGLTTLYQALPQPSARFITLEGCPNISDIARKNFKGQGAEKVRLLTGRFEKTLPQAIKQLGRLDYVFFDGNHRKAPTLAYFEQCLAAAHEDSIFVFDDIHWSAGMEEAWTEIIAHPKVSLSLDLFDMGIIFFRKENKEKEHFTLIPVRKKPFVNPFMA